MPAAVVTEEAELTAEELKLKDDGVGAGGGHAARLRGPEYCGRALGELAVRTEHVTESLARLVRGG